MDKAPQQQNLNSSVGIFLRRCDHNSKLSSVLSHMLQKEFMVDVTIYCDDGQLNAHKLVLAASSSYFRNLFLKMPNSYHYPIVVLRDTSIEDLKTVIDFMYYGEVTITSERYDSIMKCANFLLVEGISNSLNNIVATSQQHGTSQYKMTTPSSALMQNMSSGQGILPGNRPRAPPSRRQKRRMKSNDDVGGGDKSLSDYHNTLGGANVDFLQGYNNSDYSGNLDTSHDQLMNGEIFQGSRLGQNGHSSSIPAQGDSLVLHRPFHEPASALNHHDHQRIVNSLNSNCVDCSSKGGQKSNRAKHPCTICFKTFTHGFTLKRHIMQTHTQNRLSFYCELCSKNYSCRDSFLRHKKSSSHRQQSEFR